MPEAELSVDRIPGGWIGWCSVHGSLAYAWTAPHMAALDVLGHASAHHGPRDVPCR